MSLGIIVVAAVAFLALGLSWMLLRRAVRLFVRLALIGILIIMALVVGAAWWWHGSGGASSPATNHSQTPRRSPPAR